MLVLAIVLWVLGLVVAATGIAGLLEKLPPNRFVGIRTPEAVKNAQTWALANRVAGPTTALAGTLLIVGGFAAVGIGGLVGIAIAGVAFATAVGTAGFGAAIATKAAKAQGEVGNCGSACGGCSLKDMCETPTS